MIIWIALIAAIILVSISYWIAGDVWVRRHSLKFKIGNRDSRCSGAIGEIILISCGASLLYFVDRASNSVSLFEVMRTYPLYSLIGFICVTSISYYHGLTTAFKAPESEKKTLIYTYMIYGAFSAIFFFGGLLMVGLIISQTYMDYAVFQAIAPDIIAQIAQTKNYDQEGLIKTLEISFLDAQTLLASVEESMAPVFVFVAGIFAVNLGIRLTPLRSLFVNNAMIWTHGSTLMGVAIIILVGGIIYVGYYSVFIDDFLRGLASIRTIVVEADASVIQRYSDIFLSITEQKSLVGFISRMSSEWGGLAALLGLAQWLSEQFAKPEAQHSSADDNHLNKKEIEQ